MIKSMARQEEAPWYAGLPFFSAYNKFLAEASHLALNASAKISSQICHNICTPRLLPAELHRPRGSPAGAGVARQVRSVDRNSETHGTRFSTQPQNDLHLDAHRPRGRDRVTKKDPKRLNGQPIRRRILHDNNAPALAHPSNVEKKHRTHNVFERSVQRRPGTVGVEEFQSNWIQYSSKYMLNSTQQPASLVGQNKRPYSDVMDVDGLEGGRKMNRTWITPPGRLPPPRLPEHQQVPWLNPDRPSGERPVLPALSTSNLDSPPLALSATSVPPPLTNGASSPVSPASVTHYPFSPELSSEVEAKQTAYYALYPHDHKLGFNCSCSCCMMKNLKKRRALPTLFERRNSKRKVTRNLFETILDPPSPEETYYTFSPVAKQAAPSPAPASSLLSGNNMADNSRYIPQTSNLWPSLPQIPYGSQRCGDERSLERPLLGKRTRDMISTPTVSRKLPSEEYGDMKRRRKK